MHSMVSPYHHMFQAKGSRASLLKTSLTTSHAVQGHPNSRSQISAPHSKISTPPARSLRRALKYIPR